MRHKFRILNYGLRVTSYGLLFLFVLGCAAQMRNVRVGMTKKQVEEAIGIPWNVVEAKKISKGKVVEVWEYPGGTAKKKYWVYFVDGRVYSWHRSAEMWIPRPVIPRITANNKK